jgi:hypothetical protein
LIRRISWTGLVIEGACYDKLFVMEHAPRLLIEVRGRCMSVCSKLELELGVDVVVEVLDTRVAKVRPGKSVIQRWDALVQGIIDLRVFVGVAVDVGNKQRVVERRRRDSQVVA